MKRVAIGIAVGALLAVAGFSIKSMVGIVVLAIFGSNFHREQVQSSISGKGV
jgi:hypothetical protein